MLMMQFLVNRTHHSAPLTKIIYLSTITNNFVVPDMTSFVAKRVNAMFEKFKVRPPNKAFRMIPIHVAR